VLFRSLLPTPADKFCPYCGSENVQQAEAPVQVPDAHTNQHQAPESQIAGTQAQPFGNQFNPAANYTAPLQQHGFPQQVQQPEKKSLPAWAIALIAAGVVFFLIACCIAAVVFIDNASTLDDSSTRTGSGITSSVNADAPTDEEIVAHLEERYGVSFRVDWSARDSDFPVLYLQPINEAGMDFMFVVDIADIDGELLPLDEIRDGFLFALAQQDAERTLRPLFEGAFGQENVEEVSLFYSLENCWYFEGLPQNIDWNPDDGIDTLQQIIADELSDELRLLIAVRLDGSYDFDTVSWEMIEELAEDITKTDVVGLSNSLSVQLDFDFENNKRVEWRAQDGVVHSLERRDW
jgi:hypothetical protein